MKITHCILLLLLSTCIFSCSKETLGTLDYPSSYHKTGGIPNGNFRVFALSGEIKNKDLLSRFTGMDSVLFNDYLRNTIFQTGFLDSVYFSDAGHAIMNKGYNPLPCLVQREKNNILLTRTDTTFGSTIVDEMSRNVIYYIGQVKPDLYSESLYSSTRGEYVFTYSATEKFIFNVNGNELFAPLI